MNRFRRIFVSVVLLIPGLLLAQTDNVARMSAEAVMAQKRLEVATHMQLSKEEEKGFWPVYEEYAKSRAEIYDRLLKLVNTYATQYTNLSDSQARDLLQEFLAIEAEVVTLHDEYRSRFEEVLPPTKVLRFYQIDFKTITETRADIAAIVPLAK